MMKISILVIVSLLSWHTICQAQEVKTITSRLGDGWVERVVGLKEAGRHGESRFHRKFNDQSLITGDSLWLCVKPTIDLTDRTRKYPKWHDYLHRTSDFEMGILRSIRYSEKHLRDYIDAKFPDHKSRGLIIESFITDFSVRRGKRRNLPWVYWGLTPSDSVLWGEVSVKNFDYIEVFIRVNYRLILGETCQVIKEFSETVTHIKDAGTTYVEGVQGLIPPAYQPKYPVTPLKSEESVVLAAQKKMIQHVYHNMLVHVEKYIRKRQQFQNIDKPGSTRY